MYIYLITNDINGKIYIGKNQSSELWWKLNYYGSGKLIKRAISKYGKENFTKTILFETEDKKELIEKEKFYIKHYNSQNLEIGYNISNGGDGGQLKTHEELSITAKKLWQNPEYRIKQKEKRKFRIVTNKGKKFSNEIKHKLSLAKLGMKWITNINTNETKLVYDAEKYIESGEWEKGRYYNNHWIHNILTYETLSVSNVDDYISTGTWKKGRVYKYTLYNIHTNEIIKVHNTEEYLLTGNWKKIKHERNKR